MCALLIFLVRRRKRFFRDGQVAPALRSRLLPGPDAGEPGRREAGVGAVGRARTIERVRIAAVAIVVHQLVVNIIAGRLVQRGAVGRNQRAAA